MILSITARLNIYVFFVEVFGFAPVFNQIHITRLEQYNSRRFECFSVSISDVDYTFYIRCFDPERYKVCCRLFGDLAFTSVVVYWSGDQFTVHRV